MCWEKMYGEKQTKSFFSVNIRDSFGSLDWTGDAGSWGGGTDGGVSRSKAHLSGGRSSDGGKSLLQGVLLGADQD